MPRRKKDPSQKRKMHPNSIANLIKSKPGDPSLNPEGHNGRTRAEYVAAFLEAPDTSDLGLKEMAKLNLPPGTPRIVALLVRDFVAGMGSNEQARKFLIEQFGGKARVQMDITSNGETVPGVMVVPMAESQDEWEKGCREAQRKLKEDVRK